MIFQLTNSLRMLLKGARVFMSKKQNARSTQVDALRFRKHAIFSNTLKIEKTLFG